MPRKVVIVGAGIGGLAAAMDLARAGCDVQIFERAAEPGGKARRLIVAPDIEGIDAGPTVFTFREVFTELFADAGAHLEDEVSLHTTTVLARHAWRQGGQLDLLVDRAASAEHMATFAGPQAAREYQHFCKESEAIYRALRDSFMCQPLRGSTRFMLRLLQDRQRIHSLAAMWRAPPWQSLWQALHTRFTDPRLRQLFARYSTYVGSSPLAAPATLMLIAHVEQEGVWLIQGGMQALASAMARVGHRHGARYHYNCGVARLVIEGSRIRGVELDNGDHLDCDHVIFNGDAQALATGLLGTEARPATPLLHRAQRGLSAVTWCRYAETQGFELAYHNVFFAEHYPVEFKDIFEQRRITEWPTVYVCAQDRGTDQTIQKPERMLLLVNAPADGDQSGISDADLAGVEQRVERLLADCGLRMTPGPTVVTRTQDFAARFPGSAGSLYGQANHGPWASFARPSAKTPITGLWLAGGSAHPGPGVPMATLSGRMAAAECLMSAG
jgi:1-hydroxycarotenoid 3,4-desaturase